ncbi:MAG: ABC transporter permease [Prevotella sp.]|nr:ABC transporter permease [Prevotella sp.]
MIRHNLLVALRNLMKYKLQTVVSILSIAIGILTLAIVHTVLHEFKRPAVTNEPYYDRLYEVSIIDKEQSGENNWRNNISFEIMREMKAAGALPSAEKVTFPNGMQTNAMPEFYLGDELIAKQDIDLIATDDNYMNVFGVRSAITGEKIKVLKPGEAVIGRRMAKQLFGDINPVGIKIKNDDDRWSKKPALTICDVFEDVSLIEHLIESSTIYYSAGPLCVSTQYTGMSETEIYYSYRMYVVLREGRTVEQLKKEIERVLKPHNYSFEVGVPIFWRDDTESAYISIKSGVYIIGSLILLAAVIGFLRMQMQLLWMRRREISLRIVNGARRSQIFLTLSTEVTIVLLLSMLMSVLFGVWLEGFYKSTLLQIIGYNFIDTSSVYISALIIVAILFVISSLIIWLTIRRICKSEGGLAASLRRSRTHFMRNAMLTIQLVVSIFFVCTTIQIYQLTKITYKQFNVPDNDSFYKQCLLCIPFEEFNSMEFRDGLSKLPSIDKLIPMKSIWLYVDELNEREDLKGKVSTTHLHSYVVGDMSFVKFMNIDVKWFPGNADRSRFVLLNESTYRNYKELDIIHNGMLKMQNDYPVAGTFSFLPYDRIGGTAIIIDKESMQYCDYIMVPKKGRYDELNAEANALVNRMYPAVRKSIVHNMRDNMCIDAFILDCMRSIAMILSIVSLIVCAMGIYSSVALDTRGRRKEMAIRKINGAKTRNIALIFGKTYIIAIALASVINISTPLMIANIVKGTLNKPQASAIISLLLGILIVVAVTFVIVFKHIRSAMKVNPANEIVKE